MIAAELVAKIRRLFFAEHWKVGTIATELGLHRDTVCHALETDRFNQARRRQVAHKTEPYLEFIQETLQKHPRLRATRIYQMIQPRGYSGSLSQLRRIVSDLRPVAREAYLRLRTFPGEQGQVDWAHFGDITIGRARRRLSCFVLTLSYSRALYLEFFFDQTLENFLRGHVRAFQDLGVPRNLLYDNLRSAVLERRGDAIHFHPRLLELCAHYHFAAYPCHVGRGNEKGVVERSIQFIRHSYFAARPFTTLEDFNAQARLWRDHIAHGRAWPADDSMTVAQAFSQEQCRLLPLPAHPFDTDLIVPVRSGKTIYVRFDLNDYSIPPAAVGRQLVLAASDTTVRILDGAMELVRHRRSYDRHQIIAHPAHTEALLKEKRKAYGAATSTRLLAAAAESEALLDAAFARGESTAPQTRQLLQLLDEYGPLQLRAAIIEALARNTPRASSVAYLLSKRRRLSASPTPLPVDLSRRPDLAQIDVQPQLDKYDELTDNDEDS